MNEMIKKIVFWLLCVVPVGSSWAQNTNSDIVIYGATPAGIFAALNAAREGHSVALVEEYLHIGGLMTGGLSFTDFRSLESLSGTFNEYRFRVLDYYKKKYGPNSKQVADSYFGVNAEPQVTLMVFKQMLAEQPSIQVFTQHRLTKASVQKNQAGRSTITSATFIDLANGKTTTIAGKIFIDATYEGDLAVAAGAEYRIGREAREEFCEIHAGKIFTKRGQIVTGSTGEGDDKVQAYNFRLIMTDSAANRRMVEKPANYNREEFLPIAEVFTSGKVKQIFTQSPAGILRIQPLVNHKADINDIKNAPVRISSLGKNYAYPDGSSEVRAKIIAEHREHILGMIYFLQNDESIPLAARKEAREWGLAKDEFTDNDNFPYRLYIREARRIMGDVVFTENSTNLSPGSIRSRLEPNAIAICDYSLNCHGVSPPGPLYPDMTEGDFNASPQPFQIPYGVLLPKKFDNLLVPVAISSSHVGFCGNRLEPTWSAMGQAAGLAAHLSLKNQVPTTGVNVATLQALLLKKGAKIIYVSDVEAESSYFDSVQYFGSKGFFHDLYSPDEVSLRSVPILKLQYSGPMLYHDVQPEKGLDQPLAKNWIARLPKTQQTTARQLFSSKDWTRGEFLNALYSPKTN